MYLSQISFSNSSFPFLKLTLNSHCRARMCHRFKDCSKRTEWLDITSKHMCTVVSVWMRVNKTVFTVSETMWWWWCESKESDFNQPVKRLDIPSHARLHHSWFMLNHLVRQPNVWCTRDIASALREYKIKMHLLCPYCLDLLSVQQQRNSSW